jgi:hypothetical protein
MNTAKTIAFFILLLAIGSTNAATVILDGTNAVRIEDLEYGGDTYIIEFQFNSFFTLLNQDSSYFPFYQEFPNTQGFDDVIHNALHSSSAQTVGNIQSSSWWLPFDGLTGDIDAYGAVWNGSQWQQTSGPMDNVSTWATASIAPVSVPAAVWLFGSALGLLGWMRRRTQ